MNNIYDYIKYYKDSTFEEVNFNIMDSLIYSILVYLPVNNIENGSNLAKLLNEVEEKEFDEAGMKIEGKEILKLIYNSRRYEDIKIYDAKKIENETIQFGAMIFRTDNYTYVAFEGTNGTMIGWKENFNLSYGYPTETQKEAIKYLNSNINFSDKEVFVGGHSKGGNLAMSASMECKEEVFNKIKKIYNFDGPGFRKEQYNSEKYKKMKEKLYNVLPDGSLVGIIMYNDNYNFVKSSGIGVEKHNPINWHVFGQFFIEASLNESSKNIQENIYKSLEKLNDQDIQVFIDSLYDIFTKSDIRYISDLKKVKVSDIKNMIEQVKVTDEETKKLFVEVVKILINPD